MKKTMKLEKTKKFFFDTWYGALVVLFGVTTSYFVAVIVNSFRIGSFLGSARGRALEIMFWMVLGLELLSLVVFFISWIISLVKRRWKWAILQVLLGAVWLVYWFFMRGWLYVMAAYDNPSRDFYAEPIARSASVGTYGNLARDCYAEPIARSASAAVEANKEATMERLRARALEGSAVAQYYLGVSYAEGEGGFEKNPQEAVKWLRKAAEQGHAEAQYYLERLKGKAGPSLTQ